MRPVLRVLTLPPALRGKRERQTGTHWRSTMSLFLIIAAVLVLVTSALMQTEVA